MREVTIRGRDYGFSSEVRQSDALREGFFALARQVFGLDFAPWYQAGYWGWRYVPHVLTAQGRVVCNVSVNVLDTRVDGAPLRLVQLGTVMTDPAWRGQGLVDWLMREVLRVWWPQCEGMYLYANDCVLDFYPRFGFEAVAETMYTAALNPKPSPLRRLDMDNPRDVALLLSRYRQGNPYSAMPMLDGEGLLMFYCGGPLRHAVYHLEEGGQVAIVEWTGAGLVCYDVFGAAKPALPQVLQALARPQTASAALGFTPVKKALLSASPRHEADETCFVLRGGANPFDAPCMLPLLSHA